MLTLYLNVPQRYLLLQLLPKQGSIQTISQLRDATKKIRPSSSEEIELGIDIQPTGAVTWNREKGLVLRPVVVSEKALKMIVESMKELDKKESLPVHEEIQALWDQIVEGKSFEPTKEAAVDN